MRELDLGEELLTTTEAAKILRMTRKTVEDKCREGAIPAVKLFDRWRIRRGTVEAMLREGGEP